MSMGESGLEFMTGAEVFLYRPWESYSYSVTKWGDCDKPCDDGSGVGKMKREIICIDQDGMTVPTAKCEKYCKMMGHHGKCAEDPPHTVWECNWWKCGDEPTPRPCEDNMLRMGWPHGILPGSRRALARAVTTQ